MSKYFKVILILILVAISVILAVSIVALQFILKRKKIAFKIHRKNQFKTPNEADLPKTDADKFGPKSLHDFYKNINNKNDEQKPNPSSSPRMKEDLIKPLSSLLKEEHDLLKQKVTKKQISMKDSNPLHPKDDLKVRYQNIAPNTHHPLLLGESHLGLALRDIPFELHDTHKYYGDISGIGNAGGSDDIMGGPPSTYSSKFGGNALPAELKYGSIVSNDELQSSSSIDSTYAQDNDDDDDDNNVLDDMPIIVNGGGIKRRGVEFVKVENPTIAKDGNIYEKIKEQKSKLSQSTKNKIISFFSSLISKGSNLSRRKKRSSSKTIFSKQNDNNHKLFEKERSVMYHLQKASEYGNHYAQNMIANSLASGILPIRNDPDIRKHLNITLNVTSDFASLPSSNNGNNQLSRAILLWHMSAMEGNIESLMALAYRHYVSATSKSTKTQQILVHDHDLKLADLGRYKSTKKNSHSSQESNHYGVLGTCESALAYYEEAAHHIMDELESGPLRGKVTPAQDTHILPEIRQRGSSSALANNNKPDELEEAVKFMEIRATRQHEPDVHSAYKLATMYHYGIRGVKQDMKLALKYYEICAELNSWECSGQAGKFYLYGMGLEDDGRDFKKALKYFKMGMPGGISNCEERFISKNFNSYGKGDDKDEDDLDGDENDDEEDLLNEWIQKKIYQCDHPSVNGMGLLYVFGIPDQLSPNLRAAVRHFDLGNKMGNMDSMYNLAMLKLGWMNPYGDKLFHGNLDSASKNQQQMLDIKGPFTGSFMEALSLLQKSASMGHLQAKHRLGMIYSKGFELGGVLSVKPECKKGLDVYRELVTIAGTTVTKRMRAAYKQYTVGDYESSLRNYLAAAETGSVEAQVNAAFLLEEGHCLGLSHLLCMKASVRLWRAAAKSGHVEAYLKVGDFYYYGRLREDIDFDEKNFAVMQRDIEFSISPLPWVRYILYPEDLIPKLRKAAVSGIRYLLENHSKESSDTCVKEEGKCLNPDVSSSKTKGTYSKEQNDHFKIAAKYYRTAATELNSPRANFNLGFMYEWGLGLSQDFPLAKRYYDLASEAAKNTGDGAVANQIALFCLNFHEYLVKLKKSFDEGLRREREKRFDSSNDPSSTLNDNLQSSTRVAPNLSTRFGIVIYHILTWESALIFLFTLSLKALIYHRNARRQQR